MIRTFYAELYFIYYINITLFTIVSNLFKHNRYSRQFHGQQKIKQGGWEGDFVYASEEPNDFVEIPLIIKKVHLPFLFAKTRRYQCILSPSVIILRNECHEIQIALNAERPNFSVHQFRLVDCSALIFPNELDCHPPRGEGEKTAHCRLSVKRQFGTEHIKRFRMSIGATSCARISQEKVDKLRGD